MIVTQLPDTGCPNARLVGSGDEEDDSVAESSFSTLVLYVLVQLLTCLLHVYVTTQIWICMVLDVGNYS